MSPAFVQKKVVSLMEIRAHRWDIDLVLDMFNERDQILYFGISLNDNVRENSYYWSEDRLGRYIINSAYNHIQNYKGNWQPSGSSGFWQKSGTLKFRRRLKM